MLHVLMTADEMARRAAIDPKSCGDPGVPAHLYDTRAGAAKALMPPPALQAARSLAKSSRTWTRELYQSYAELYLNHLASSKIARYLLNQILKQTRSGHEVYLLVSESEAYERSVRRQLTCLFAGAGIARNIIDADSSFPGEPEAYIQSVHDLYRERRARPLGDCDLMAFHAAHCRA